MSSNYYNGQLGDSSPYGGVSEGRVVSGAPTETVINGITYRTENGVVYRKENGRLIPITNPQELLALDRQFTPTPPMYIPVKQGYGNNSNSGSSTVLLIGAGLLLLYLVNK
jgi:hypothetical protein